MSADVSRERKRKNSKKHKESRSGDKAKSRRKGALPPAGGGGGLKITFKFGGSKIRSSTLSTTKASPPRLTHSSDEEDVQQKPKTLTARQKSMLVEAEAQRARQASKDAAPVTADVYLNSESIAKREAAYQRRKMLTEKQRQEEKHATVQKLLQKQSSSRLLKETQSKGERPQVSKEACIRLVSNKSGIFLNIPTGSEFPFSPQTPRSYPPTKSKCAIEGCNEFMRYSDAASGKPLCSLRCYKQLNAVTSTSVESLDS